MQYYGVVRVTLNIGCSEGFFLHSTKAPTPAASKSPLPTVTTPALEVSWLKTELPVGDDALTVVVADVTSPPKPLVEVASEKSDVVV